MSSRSACTHPATPPPPVRPYSEYNLFFRLERLRLIQTIGSVDDELLASFAPPDHYDPVEHPRPSAYADVRCPPYWYSITHSNTPERKGLGGVRRKHRKSVGKIDFKTQARTISANWKNVDTETLMYVTRIARLEMIEHERLLKAHFQKYGGGRALAEHTMALATAPDQSLEAYAVALDTEEWGVAARDMSVQSKPAMTNEAALAQQQQQLWRQHAAPPTNAVAAAPPRQRQKKVGGGEKDCEKTLRIFDELLIRQLQQNQSGDRRGNHPDGGGSAHSSVAPTKTSRSTQHQAKNQQKPREEARQHAAGQYLQQYQRDQPPSASLATAYGEQERLLLQHAQRQQEQLLLQQRVAPTRAAITGRESATRVSNQRPDHCTSESNGFVPPPAPSPEARHHQHEKDQQIEIMRILQHQQERERHYAMTTQAANTAALLPPSQPRTSSTVSVSGDSHLRNRGRSIEESGKAQVQNGSLDDNQAVYAYLHEQQQIIAQLGIMQQRRQEQERQEQQLRNHQQQLKEQMQQYMQHQQVEQKIAVDHYQHEIQRQLRHAQHQLHPPPTGIANSATCTTAEITTAMQALPELTTSSGYTSQNNHQQQSHNVAAANGAAYARHAVAPENEEDRMAAEIMALLKLQSTPVTAAPTITPAREQQQPLREEENESHSASSSSTGSKMDDDAPSASKSQDGVSSSGSEMDDSSFGNNKNASLASLSTNEHDGADSESFREDESMEEEDDTTNKVSAVTQSKTTCSYDQPSQSNTKTGKAKSYNKPLSERGYIVGSSTPTQFKDVLAICLHCSQQSYINKMMNEFTCYHCGFPSTASAPNVLHAPSLEY